MERNERAQPAGPAAAAAAQGPAKPAEAPAEPKFEQFLKGFYGTLDVSLDDATKGIRGLRAARFPMPVPARERATSTTDRRERRSSAASAGSATCRPTRRCSAIAEPAWGKLKIGTTYSPYKRTTDRMNPFSGMLGDYAVIMGNTGGDNRVEFGTRLDHSIWFESPKYGNEFSFDLLISPGANRTYDDVVQSSGSPDCSGGNTAGSGNLPLNCDDGGFGTAYSADLKFESGGRSSTGARTTAMRPSTARPSSPRTASRRRTSTTSPTSGRSRAGYITPSTSGWRSAASTSTCTATCRRHSSSRTSGSAWEPGSRTPMISRRTTISAAWKHRFDKNLYGYLDAADTVNDGNAHYDIGAGGRGVTTDCHDGTNTVFNDYSSAGPTTWGGCHAIGVSMGMNYKF